jgi:hypothetical protein
MPFLCFVCFVYFVVAQEMPNFKLHSPHGVPKVPCQEPGEGPLP